MTRGYGKSGDRREASGGRIDKPIPTRSSGPSGGVGRLAVGWHDVEALAVTRTRGRVILVLQNSAGHVHAEDLTDAPMWVRIGLKLRVRIVPTAGAALERDGVRYRAVDARTGAPLTDWDADPSAVVRRITVPIASTTLAEVINAANQTESFTIPTDPAGAGPLPPLGDGGVAPAEG